MLLGETVPLLAGSRWARELHGETGGQLAPLDLEAHRRLCDPVRELVVAGSESGGARRQGAGGTAGPGGPGRRSSRQCTT